MQPNSLKQRLIGAIVLVALAVIFIPMLLNGGNGEKGVSFGTNIPHKPSEQREVHVLKLDDLPEPPAKPPPGRALIDKGLNAPPPGGPAPAEPEGNASDKGAKKPPESKPPKSKSGTAKDTGAAAAPNAWAVQVGSFSHQKNALALRDRLRAKHFRAFVDAVNSTNGTVYRVRVGPEVRRADAEALQKRLAKHIKGKTLVVAHP